MQNDYAQEPTMGTNIEDPRGVLRPRSGERVVRLSWYPPSQDLEFFVEHYFVFEWDLRDRKPRSYEALPHPRGYLINVEVRI